MQSLNLADKVADWARRTTTVKASILIGSRARRRDDQIWKADLQSDWDFQIITSRPDIFESRDWTLSLGSSVQAYVVRRAAIGGVPKIAVLFEHTEADFVILPAALLRVSRLLMRFGVHRKSRGLRAKLRDLAVIIRPGWTFLTGAPGWEPFYRQVIAEIPDARLSDSEVISLATGFACDVVWTTRKIARGEWLAAQRMIHRSLQETNFRLLHEIRLRRDERTFPEARRAEFILSVQELDALNVCATLDANSLSNAVKKTSATCRKLMFALVGDGWNWPLNRDL